MIRTQEEYENHLSDTEAKWFAVYTRYKAEKEVMRQLQRNDIEAYVPLNRQVRQYASKRKVVELPLMHCYVFVKIKKTQYVAVLETNNVVKFIRFSKNLISIPEREINLLKRICDTDLSVEAAAIEFIPGHPVEIIGGRLTGIQGKLIDQKNKIFLVELNQIGFGLRIELDPKLLKPLKPVGNIENEEVNGLLKNKYGI